MSQRTEYWCGNCKEAFPYSPPDLERPDLEAANRCPECGLLMFPRPAEGVEVAEVEKGKDDR